MRPKRAQRRGRDRAHRRGCSGRRRGRRSRRILLFFDSGGGYTVKARFTNAGQLVKGNLVEVGGVKAGIVTRLPSHGRRPGRGRHVASTTSTRRCASARPRRSGRTRSRRPSGRYIELFLPSEDQAGGDIPDGGVLGIDRTTSTVELDQLFNTLDPGDAQEPARPVRRPEPGLHRPRRGQANRGLIYLSPQLATTTRLFEELRHDPRGPRALPGRLVAPRDDARQPPRRPGRADRQPQHDDARARQRRATRCAELLERFPGFLRQANTTYVDLRFTLDELDPFGRGVEARRAAACSPTCASCARSPATRARPCAT